MIKYFAWFFAHALLAAFNFSVVWDTGTFLSIANTTFFIAYALATVSLILDGGDDD